MSTFGGYQDKTWYTSVLIFRAQPIHKEEILKMCISETNMDFSLNDFVIEYTYECIYIYLHVL